MSAPESARRELRQDLGFWASTSVVMGSMIGTGIFLMPGVVARGAGSLSWAAGAWVLAGLMSLFGAVSYAEMGAAMPVAGGDYVYIGRAFGPVWGFLYGWKSVMLASPVSGAALAAGTALFFQYFVPGLAEPALRFGGWSPTGGQLLGALLLAAMAIVNLLAVRTVGALQVLLTGLKTAGLAAVVGVAVVYLFRGNPGLTTGMAESPSPQLGGFVAALTAALWTYTGWHQLLWVGSEVRHPGTTLPRALIGGFSATAVLFVLVNLSCFAVLGFARVAASDHAVSDLLQAAWGGPVAAMVTAAMILSALGSLNASLLAGGRLPYAMARDGLAPAGLEYVSIGARVPARAVVYPALLGCTLVLTGTFEELASFYVFTQWLFFAIGVMALFRLRQTEPDLARPVRAWGYPVLPAIFVALCLSLAVSLYLQQPVRSSLGLAIILAGLPYYRMSRRRLASPRGT
jgi:APA family basic amino acid/polyamine antiporter